MSLFKIVMGDVSSDAALGIQVPGYEDDDFPYAVIAAHTVNEEYPDIIATCPCKKTMAIVVHAINYAMGGADEQSSTH